MRIVLVSDHTLTASHQLPCQVAKSLAQNGMQVYWLAAANTVKALTGNPDLRSAEANDMPATCHHVIPYTLHHLHDVQIIGIEATFWQDTALHTRLFTFLRLLHQERPFTALQAWGRLPTAYLTVYTAVLLGLPGTVVYTPSCLRDGPHQAFLWHWVAQHVAKAFTTHADDREQLIKSSSLQPGQVEVIDPDHPAIGPNMVVWYQALAQNFQEVAKNPYNL